ncbi:MAG: putative rane protein [Labilithrix sp.]|nr:putative rane protein [Labilithrix sp.]
MKLNDKLQLALDESRMLVLGVQVFLGFDLQAFVMAGWESLAPSVRAMRLVNLGLLLAATVLLLAPVARHRIVDEGRDTPNLHAFTRRVTTFALLPLAGALALDSYMVGWRVSGTKLGIGLAAGIGAAAMGAWYLVPILMRRHARSEDEMEETKVDDKVRHVLTEARVVLPGTQALLGFQFAAVLQQGFDRLPASSKLIHVAALVFLGASVVFLMLPAAYHRIAEDGEVTERLHRLSSVSILLAMFTLAIAVAADTFIVVRKATDSVSTAAGIGAAWLAIALATWFGLMFFLRFRRERSAAAGLGGGLGFERG